MKVAHLTSVHARPDIRVFFKECVSIADEGIDVTLIAPDPDLPYPESDVQVITVTRNRNRLKRMTQTVWQVVRTTESFNPDIVHIHSPELLPYGIWRKIRGGKVVYDAHEDLPDQIVGKDWIPSALRNPVAWFAQKLIGVVGRVFDGIVAATPTIAEDYPKDKTIVLRNLPRKSEISDNVSIRNQDGPIVYVGGITKLRGISELVKAMEIVGPRTNRKLTLYGPVSDAYLEELTALAGWAWVDHKGLISTDLVPKVLSESSVGVVTFLDSPNHRRAEPNKLFEYMLAGLPVVASNFEYWNQFVSDPKTGIQVDPASSDHVAAALISLLEDPVRATEMGNRGRSLVLDQYTWEMQVPLLLDFYREVSQA